MDSEGGRVEHLIYRFSDTYLRLADDDMDFSRAHQMIVHLCFHLRMYALMNVERSCLPYSNVVNSSAIASTHKCKALK